jgi:hypothetical protein
MAAWLPNTFRDAPPFDCPNGGPGEYKLAIESVETIVRLASNLQSIDTDCMTAFVVDIR